MTDTSKRRLPAEWERQSGVQLTWPHKDTDWQPHLAKVEPCFAEIARAIAKCTKLIVATVDPEHVRGILDAAHVNMTNVSIYNVPSTDSWARDHGAITVLENGAPQLLDFTFNGWGGRYPAEIDNLITRRLSEQGAFGTTPLKAVDFILEGGSIETDGEGTLLTTSRCLLSPKRNKGLGRAEIETLLKRELGFSRVLWLEHGYQAGDDTDAHIDILARFCDASTIAYVSCEDPADEHYGEMSRMEEELRAFRTPDGSPYELVPLPSTRPILDRDDERLPASYANFLIINGAVLVPTYADIYDKPALESLKQCFPDRDIVGIDCRPLILQHGSLHCVTMQFPEGVLP